MRNVVLRELMMRWIEEAKAPETEDGSKEAEISNAMASATRETKRECADTLSMLMDILPD